MYAPSAVSNAIPFLDLVSPHAELEEELTSVLRQVLRTAGFVGGPMVEEFERAFAAFCDVSHSIGVSNGTDALRFAIMAAGVRPGDAVLTVPNTFIATTEAISQAGAFPEFLDVDSDTCNMSVAKLRQFLEQQCVRGSGGRPVSRRSGRPVTAVVPVHLYGQMADMDPILDLAHEFGLMVIEDACQAHGAEYHSRKLKRWVKAGSMGIAAAFSFYPGKNLGACGEAGAVTTNDEAIAATVKMLRDHGQVTKYYHDMEGYNGRLDSLQAGFLHTKLAYLPEWNAQRRDRAAEYKRLLAAEPGIGLLHEPSWSRSVYHLYVIRALQRDELMNHLKLAGIGTGLHYPVPLHLQNAYNSLNHNRGDFPVAERLAREIISLPMYPQLTSSQQAQVRRELADFYSRSAVNAQLAENVLAAADGVA